MTHLVAGYPDLKTSRELLLAMAENGADLIEVQIPFSEPLGDGPTILTASHRALEQGVRPLDCMEMTARLQPRISMPLLFMTYANIPWQMGMEKFISAAASAGACGLIIPDLPFDEEDGGYLELSRSHGLHPIQLLSPGMAHQRRKLVLRQASGFVYLTLRVGVTGAGDPIAASGLALIAEIKKVTGLPLAAGFGISSLAQVREVARLADIVIVGSHLITLLDKGGIPAVAEFLRASREALSLADGEGQCQEGQGMDRKK
jgi:tryptophan synthase alpha chain